MRKNGNYIQISGEAWYRAEIKIIPAAGIFNVSEKSSAVFFALIAGLDTNASILNFLSASLFAIKGASDFPLSFSGRSKSLPKKL